MWIEVAPIAARQCPFGSSIRPWRLHMLDRRRFLTAFAAAGAATVAGPGMADSALPTVRVTKDPNCGCCEGWVDHMRRAGFPVEVTSTPTTNRVKAQLGVPDDLASCHTAVVGGYVIEGHVPADAVKHLLAVKPAAKGLAVPGMPVGSPGMEADGTAPDTYDVVLFGATGRTTFVTYEGSRRL